MKFTYEFSNLTFTVFDCTKIGIKKNKKYISPIFVPEPIFGPEPFLVFQSE